MNFRKLSLFLLCAGAVGAGLLIPHIQWWMKLVFFAALLFLEVAPQDDLTRRQKYMVLSLFALGIIAGYGYKTYIE